MDFHLQSPNFTIAQTCNVEHVHITLYYDRCVYNIVIVWSYYTYTIGISSFFIRLFCPFITVSHTPCVTSIGWLISDHSPSILYEYTLTAFRTSNLFFYLTIPNTFCSRKQYNMIYACYEFTEFMLSYVIILIDRMHIIEVKISWGVLTLVIKFAVYRNFLSSC